MSDRLKSKKPVKLRDKIPSSPPVIKSKPSESNVAVCPYIPEWSALEKGLNRFVAGSNTSTVVVSRPDRPSPPMINTLPSGRSVAE